jgi:peptidoglycan/xylan/chitin deacetylase (PgdA/CDA1 family)
MWAGARRTALAAFAAGVAWQIGPAGSWLPPLRPRRLSGAGDAGTVAVTFDDGPDPYGTPAVLDALDALGWTATFFVLGTQVRRDPGLLREVAARGHDVALHGDDHRYLIARPPWAVRSDLARGAGTVGDVLGQAPRWWRPPYGVLSGPALTAARRLGLAPVIWTAWGRDWRASASPTTVIRDVTAHELAGATVLLHDSDLMSAEGSWRVTVAALPLLAGQIERRGLAVRPLSEHLTGGPGTGGTVRPAPP